MSLSEIRIKREVWLTCLTHAFSTESEEIMGLLLGDIEKSEDGRTIAHVWYAIPQSREDRRKDRVETSPEQVTAAGAVGEALQSTTRLPTRVVGWYHSHPHITVHPSHVDLRTQWMHQMLDPGFVGLIVSCFNSTGGETGSVQVLAFQALDSGQANFSAGTPPGTRSSGTSESDMEEAMRLSRQQHHQQQFCAINVPLYLVDSPPLPPSLSTRPLLELQQLLREEERKGFQKALDDSKCPDGKVPPLVFLQLSAHYHSSLGSLINTCLAPALTSLESLLPPLHHVRGHQA